jgi:hypothetical protein
MFPPLRFAIPTGKMLEVKVNFKSSDYFHESKEGKR